MGTGLNSAGRQTHTLNSKIARFHTEVFIGGGEGERQRMEGKNECCILKFTLSKRYVKGTELTTSSTKEHVHDGKVHVRK